MSLFRLKIEQFEDDIILYKMYKNCTKKNHDSITIKAQMLPRFVKKIHAGYCQDALARKAAQKWTFRCEGYFSKVSINYKKMMRLLQELSTHAIANPCHQIIPDGLLNRIPLCETLQ